MDSTLDGGSNSGIDRTGDHASPVAGTVETRNIEQNQTVV
jgi:hypothetical protein